VTAGTLDLAGIRDSIHGRVIAPGDESYDADRRVVMGGVDARPAAIVRVADTDDVRAVLALARTTGLPLAVRCGGHSGAAHSTVEGGLVLDVRDLNAIEVDVAGRTAWVGAGMTAGEVTNELAAHGLAVGFGDTGSVGVSGITLGGGIGYLVRKHGMTIDNLLAAEIVTGTGEVMVADATTNPDLFWAVRGGGGNMGVATRFRFRLAEVGQVVGGLLVQPATVESITALMRAASAAPEALSLIGNVMPCPPLPFVDAAHHGEVVIFSLACWCGPLDEADAALAPVRAAAPPIGDMLRPMSYAEIYGPQDPDYRPLAVARNLFMDDVDEADARLMLDRLAAIEAPMKVVQLRPLGGAMARVPADATAFAHRTRAVMANVAAFYTGPDDLGRTTAWVEALTRDLRDGPDAYVNFVTDEGPAGVRAAYPPETYARLARIKRRYDPENLLRRNQNVEPAPA
jgi:FAD/FMN-containing dehydrogenase